MKETVEENASTTERVFQDRQYQVLTLIQIDLYSFKYKWKHHKMYLDQVVELES